jgi:hypothetical protein
LSRAPLTTTGLYLVAKGPLNEESRPSKPSRSSRVNLLGVR